MKIELPANETRIALQRLVDQPVKAQENLILAEPEMLFLPLRHKEALHWDASVVVGMRGAGKSVWTAALNDPTMRGVMARDWNLDQLRHVDVLVAFGQDVSDRLFPSPSTLADLLDRLSGVKRALIWQTVLFKRVVDEIGGYEAFAIGAGPGWDSGALSVNRIDGSLGSGHSANDETSRKITPA